MRRDWALRALFCQCAWIALIVATAVAQTPESATEEEVPEGVTMLLARGGIPAIFEPEFVPATEASIPDSAWVFGVEIGGVAKAYSLNLLNHHEVVNDRSGELAFATVW